MKKQTRLTAMLSALLIGLGLRALARVLREEKPSREKALLIALLIAVVSIAGTCLLWVFGLI